MLAKLAPIALAVVLSATPVVAVATDVTVQIDPGNPYSQTATPPTENVLVTLTGPVTRSQRTVAGKTTFTGLPEGSYKLTFPEQRVFTPGEFELPYIDPVENKPADELIINPKFTPEQISPSVIDKIATIVGIPVVGGMVYSWLAALGLVPGLGLLSSHKTQVPEPVPPETEGGGQLEAATTAPSTSSPGGQTLQESLRRALASTGANVLWVMALGFAIVLAGFILLIARRNKERNAQ
ncbi:MAG: LPXTG cell wall anchor domain-containing protein [Corynebacterium glucuronolyticum]|nr:LPXTG cell wall anchor domain-containing protein [Mycobacteriaceae bacterium]MDY5834164.1 LPXTG cell wall anchor domain-containing protein [Corynebacterium glucuronolyticum]